MKRKTIAAILSANIVISGLFGFGGAYLENQLSGAGLTQSTTQTASSGATSSTGSANSATQSSSDSTASGNTIQKTNTASQTGALTIAQVAEKTCDSVVEIATETVVTGGRVGQYVSQGAGSGVIIKSDGYIVTNNHVIDGASKITVKLRNGTSYTATLLGKDSQTDIAVLKIDANNLTAATFGDSSKLVVGELAVAIGNPLGELGGTVTEGIISALDRNIEIDGETMSLLQTSAAINPGNSGGGLFNEYAQLIGIVNAKSSGSGIEGLGFAVPINSAKTVIDDIIKYGYVKGRIDLGVTMVDVSDSRTAMTYRVSETGVYITKVSKQNGLKAGDRIISVNDTEVTSSSQVKSIVQGLTAGQTAKFTVKRSGQTLTLNITLEEAKS
ncbi:MAG: trypsin-like peptidase domain-containing protein [Clostridiaceae bacterium]